MQNETEDRMTRIKHKIVIGSGKGDMGKTFTKKETPAAKAFDKVVGAILVRLYGREAPSLHQNL